MEPAEPSAPASESRPIQGSSTPCPASASTPGPVVSSDLFYDGRGLEREWARAGALAVEMEAATLFALGAVRDVEAAALLVVSDLLLPARLRIAPDELREAELRMGRAALSALGPVPELQP